MSNVRRDRWGRALIVPPEGGKAVPYVRPSSLPDELGDRFNIEQWKLRQCVLGLARRPDLVAHAATLTGDDKGKLAEIVDAALEMVGESTGANFGSAIHAFIEHRLDPATSPWIPAQVAIAGAGVMRALAENGFELVDGTSETFVVNDAIRAAGSLDGLVARDGQTFLFDIKSDSGISKVADYKVQKWATQLAIYAHAEHGYDFDAEARIELGAPWRILDRSIGVVAHVSRETGECVLRFPDLAWGWESAQLARAVYDRKKTKAVALQALEASTPVVPVAPAVDGAAVAMRAELAARIDVLRGVDGGIAALQQRWPAGVATLKQSDAHTVDELALIRSAVEQAEATCRVPFEDAPQPEPETVPAPEAKRRPDVEGGAVDADAMALLRDTVIASLPADLIRTIAADAHALGDFDINMRRATRRRFAIGRILLALASLGEDEVRAAGAAVLGIDAPLMPTFSLGQLVGILHADEAEQIAALLTEHAATDASTSAVA